MVDFKDMTKEEILERFQPVYMSVEAIIPTVKGRSADHDLYFTAMLRQLVASFATYSQMPNEQLATLIEREAQQMRQGTKVE